MSRISRFPPVPGRLFRWSRGRWMAELPVQPRSESRGCVVEIASHHLSSSSTSGRRRSSSSPARRDVQSAGDSRPCFAFLPIAHALFLAREISSLSPLFTFCSRLAVLPLLPSFDRSRSFAKGNGGRDETRGRGGHAPIATLSLDRCRR